jgi:tRNA (guanine10-N2)-methyltransferase
MSDLVKDLIEFAATFLVVGYKYCNQSGRLVFWLPTLNEQYQPNDIPAHPSFKLVANSQQDFGKWSRRYFSLI